MRVLDKRVTMAQLLVAWGLHEGRGRFSDGLPPQIRTILAGADSSAETQNVATLLIREVRQPILGPVERAGVTGICVVELDPADGASIVVLGDSLNAPPIALADRARQLSSNPHVVRLSQHPIPDNPAPVAVGRRPELPFVLIDGVHRASAWFLRCAAGHTNPIRVALIQTQERCFFEG